MVFPYRGLHFSPDFEEPNDEKRPKDGTSTEGS
jgi:hypothetical protein